MIGPLALEELQSNCAKFGHSTSWWIFHKKKLTWSQKQGTLNIFKTSLQKSLGAPHETSTRNFASVSTLGSSSFPRGPRPLVTDVLMVGETQGRTKQPPGMSSWSKLKANGSQFDHIWTTKRGKLIPKRALILTWWRSRSIGNQWEFRLWPHLKLYATVEW